MTQGEGMGCGFKSGQCLFMKCSKQSREYLRIHYQIIKMQQTFMAPTFALAFFMRGFQFDICLQCFVRFAQKQDDYTRCRRVAEVPKIRVTSQGGPCQFVYIFHMIQFEKLSLFNAEIDSV